MSPLSVCSEPTEHLELSEENPSGSPKNMERLELPEGTPKTCCIQWMKLSIYFKQQLSRKKLVLLSFREIADSIVQVNGQLAGHPAFAIALS